MSQAIRGIFLFFKGGSPLTPIFASQDGKDCSSMIACAGLVRKTIEIRGDTADFVNQVVVEATMSEGANDKANWFAVTAPIGAPGLYTIVTDSAGLYHEPEVTFLRIRAQGEIGAMPRSISATMAAVWEGECSWDKRLKSNALGSPYPNHEYKAV